MKITIEGITTDGKNEREDVTIEYQGGTQWLIKLGKTEVITDKLEKSMAFLKDDFNKAEKK